MEGERRKRSSKLFSVTYHEQGQSEIHEPLSLPLKSLEGKFCDKIKSISAGDIWGFRNKHKICFTLCVIGSQTPSRSLTYLENFVFLCVSKAISTVGLIHRAGGNFLLCQQ